MQRIEIRIKIFYYHDVDIGDWGLTMWGNFGDGDGASSLSQGRKGLLGVQGSNALSLMLCKNSLLMMPPYKPQYLIVREMKGCFSVEECGVGQKLRHLQPRVYG